MGGTVRPSGGRLLLVRHYAEMAVAMVLGMATLYPAWAAAVAGVDGGWLVRTEVEACAMATAMAVPMAGWMIVRGHGVAATVEMSLAMYAGFFVFFPFLWAELIGRSGVLALGHVAMLLLMALVMARRHAEHTDLQ